MLASASGVRITTLAELGISPDPAEDEVEQHETFVANAIAKARYFAQLTGRPTIADDSGLMVDALGGLPGVRTKRFAADHGLVNDDVDQANNDLLLARLRDIMDDDQRGAQYVCAAAFMTAAGDAITSIGTCAGTIARTPLGTGGFGYDPLFYFPELQVTFAQLTRAQKNLYSHRARAFRALAAHLK